MNRTRRRIVKLVDALRTDGASGVGRLSRAWIERRRRDLIMRTLPRQISIEVTSYCNLKCPMCPRTIEVELLNGPEEDRQQYSFARPSTRDFDRHIDVSVFTRILDAIPQVRELLLFCPSGETMLHPEVKEIMRIAGSCHGVRPIVTTNATVLDQVRAEALIQHAFLVDLSIDGGSEEVYGSIRIGSQFQRVMNNVEDFVSMRGSKRYPLIDINYVLQPGNIEDLPSLFERLQKIGIRYITLYEPHMTHHHVAEKHELSEDHRFRADQLAERGRAMGLMIRQSRCRNLADRKAQAGRLAESCLTQGSECLAPWRTPHITLDGDVTPCWYAPTKEMMHLGNVLERPFAEIWNSPLYQDLRRAHRPNDSVPIPAFCRICPWLTTEWRHPEGDVSGYLASSIN